MERLFALSDDQARKWIEKQPTGSYLTEFWQRGKAITNCACGESECYKLYKNEDLEAIIIICPACYGQSAYHERIVI